MFPVDVADFSLWMLGFSGIGLGILDSHGKSGDGGAWILGAGETDEFLEDGIMLKLHLSQTATLGDKSRVRGLGWSADTPTDLVKTTDPPTLASFLLTFLSSSVMVP